MQLSFQPKHINGFPWESVKALLCGSKNFTLFTHRNPDGDAVGSTSALAKYLLAKGHKATIVFPNEVPSNLLFLVQDTHYLFSDKQPEEVMQCLQKSDVLFGLDFNDWKRTEYWENELKSTLLPALIMDHHPEPAVNNAWLWHDTEASSTCELVFKFLYHWDNLSSMSLSIAQSIYAGMVTDTGSFRYRNTSAETMMIGATLLSLGVRPDFLQDQLFSGNRFEKLQLWGYALGEKLCFLPQLSLAYIALDAGELSRYSSQEGDLEGLVNYALSIQGAEVGVLISQRQGKVRISFRSKGKYNVNTFARTYFDGGGHEMAAGGSSDLSVEDTIERLKACFAAFISS